MEIIDFKWNSFWVLFPRGDKEGEREYLQRAIGCLREFYGRYTTDEQPVDIFWGEKETLDSRVVGGNFCDMRLETDCDVKYDVRPDGAAEILPGIFVYSHAMESRRFQVEFLRGKVGRI